MTSLVKQCVQLYDKLDFLCSKGKANNIHKSVIFLKSAHLKYVCINPEHRSGRKKKKHDDNETRRLHTLFQVRIKKIM